jgi:hypothetical protein
MNDIGKSRPSGSYRSISTSAATGSSIEIGRDLVALVTERMEEKIAEFSTLYRELEDVMTGPGRKRTQEDARRRLQNPRLRTTYVAERHRALVSRRIDLCEVIAAHLRPAVSSAVELEVVEIELAAVEARIEELNAVRPAKERTGLYPQAAGAVDRLYEEHGVDRWHWGRAGHAQLKRIAEILRER